MRKVGDDSSFVLSSCEVNQLTLLQNPHNFQYVTLHSGIETRNQILDSQFTWPVLPQVAVMKSRLLLTHHQRKHPANHADGQTIPQGENL